MASTPRLVMDYLSSGQADQEILHNESMNILDSLVGLNIIDRTLSTPPTAANGEAYIVATGGTGAWSGHDGEIAIYYNNQWAFIEPVEGMMAWLSTEGFMIRFVGSDWKSATGECMFVARKTTDQSFTTWVGVNWETEVRKDSNYTHSASSHQITLKEPGWYRVDVDLTIEQTATAAYNFSEMKLVLAGADVTGSLSRTTTHFGNQNIMTMHLSMTFNSASANQVLEVQVQRHTGAATVKVPANYSRLTVVKV